MAQGTLRDEEEQHLSSGRAGDGHPPTRDSGLDDPGSNVSDRVADGQLALRAVLTIASRGAHNGVGAARRAHARRTLVAVVVFRPAGGHRGAGRDGAGAGWRIP